MKCIVDNKDFMALCESDSSTAQVRAALEYFLKCVDQVEEAAKAAKEPAEEAKVD